MVRKPNTREMVDAALYSLSTKRGVSLHAIKKYIEEEYSIEISVQRKTLVNKYLHELLSEGLVQNVSGRGLTGRLRLVRSRLKSTRLTQTRNSQQSNATVVASPPSQQTPPQQSRCSKMPTNQRKQQKQKKHEDSARTPYNANMLPAGVAPNAAPARAQRVSLSVVHPKQTPCSSFTYKSMLRNGTRSRILQQQHERLRTPAIKQSGKQPRKQNHYRGSFLLP